MLGRRESLCEKWFLSKTTDAASILIYLAYMKDPETNLRVLAKTLTSPSLIFWPLLMTKPALMTFTWSEVNFFKVLQKVFKRKKSILWYTILWNTNNAKIESLTFLTLPMWRWPAKVSTYLFIQYLWSYTHLLPHHCLTEFPSPSHLLPHRSQPFDNLANRIIQTNNYNNTFLLIVKGSPP